MSHDKFKLRVILYRHCKIHNHHRKTSECCDVCYTEKQPKCTPGRCSASEMGANTGCLINPEATTSQKCNLQGPRMPSPGWYCIGKSAFRWAAPVNKWLAAKQCPERSLQSASSLSVPLLQTWLRTKVPPCLNPAAEVSEVATWVMSLQHSETPESQPLSFMQRSPWARLVGSLAVPPARWCFPVSAPLLSESETFLDRGLLLDCRACQMPSPFPSHPSFKGCVASILWISNLYQLQS